MWDLFKLNDYEVIFWKQTLFFLDYPLLESYYLSEAESLFELESFLLFLYFLLKSFLPI